MKQIRRWAGIIWIALGPLAIIYLVKTGLSEIARKPVIDTRIQWGIFIIVFIPIAIGLVIFGWYSLKGEYDRLP